MVLKNDLHLVVKSEYLLVRRPLFVVKLKVFFCLRLIFSKLNDVEWFVFFPGKNAGFIIYIRGFYAHWVLLFSESINVLGWLFLLAFALCGSSAISGDCPCKLFICL